MIRIKCPKCANPLGIPDAQGGSVASCPKCGQKFRVPTLSAKTSNPSGPNANSGPGADRKDERPSAPKPARKQIAPDEDTPEPARARRQPAASEHADEEVSAAPLAERRRRAVPVDQAAADEDEADDQESKNEE